MKFACEKCGKKYSIPDEKVAGRVLKVRCKSCDNAIVVRGEAQAPAREPEAESDNESTRMMSVDEVRRLAGATGGAPKAPPPEPPRQDAAPEPPPAPPQDDETGWFVMMDGRQIGPMGMPALKEQLERGKLSAKSYVWKEGMGEWKRAREVDALAPLLEASAKPQAAPPPPLKRAAPPPIPPRKKVESPLAGALTGEVPTVSGLHPLAAPMGGGASAASAPAPSFDDPTIAAGPGFAGEPVHDEPPEQPQKRNGKLPSGPHDAVKGNKAAAFAAEELEKAEQREPERSEPEQSEPEQSEPERSEPERSEPEPPEEDPFAAASAGSEDLPAPPPGEATRFFIRQAGVNKRNSPMKILAWVAGAAGVVALAVVGVMSFPSVRAAVAAKVHSDKVYSATDDEQAKGLLTAKQLAEKKAAEKAKPAARPLDESQKPKGKIAATDEQLLDLLANKADAKPDVQMEKVEVPKPGSEGGLDPDQVMKTVSGSQKAFEACIMEALRRDPNARLGKVKVMVTVMPSGIVSGAQITNSPTVDRSDLGDCLKASCKRMVFPAFEGEAEDIELPLVLGRSF